MKSLIKRVLARAGLDLRRAPNPSLPRARRLVLGDLEFPFWLANAHALQWWGSGNVNLTAEFQFLRTRCHEGAVVLDVGAHHGIQAVPMARWCGATGRVHAFEASAENALVLFANAALNGLLNCECNHAAVSDAPGELRMTGETVGRGTPGRPTPSVTLDGYCGERGIGRVDLLKIDVEGFEAQVLRGARRVLAGRPAISLELHLDDLARYGSSRDEVLDLVALEEHDVRMMCRDVSWQETVILQSRADLPSGGVVNLFLLPRDPGSV